MRCLLAAIRCEKGDVAGNLSAHLRLAGQAAVAGCQLAVFPEMSLTGSADPVTHPERLIPLDDPAVTRLAAASAAGIGLCFGITERASDQRPYITHVVAQAGAVTGVQRKRYLGDGEEAFTPAAESAVFEHGGVRLLLVGRLRPGRCPPPRLAPRRPHRRHPAVIPSSTG